MAAETVFNEWYGDVSPAQLRAYKRCNVSPSDHRELADHFGQDAHERIAQEVIKRSPDGYYKPPLFNDWDE